MPASVPNLLFCALVSRYPTVVYDPDEPLGKFRCWYDDHSAKALAYANSSDGITWQKPSLGIIDLGGDIGTSNNLVVRGNGIGVYLDKHETNASRKFKGFGALGRSTSADGGTIISADGLHWGEPHVYNFPDPPQRYDTSNNLFWDDQLRQYVATTRRHPTTSKTDADRAIAVVLSPIDRFDFSANVSEVLRTIPSLVSTLVLMTTTPSLVSTLALMTTTPSHAHLY